MLKISGQDTIRYLPDEPVIDGYADAMLPGFKLNAFNTILKSDDHSADVNAACYLAYDVNFLYLYIEAEADSLTIRDRGLSEWRRLSSAHRKSPPDQENIPIAPKPFNIKGMKVYIYMSCVLL